MGRWRLLVASCVAMLCVGPQARAVGMAEYEVKAAFLLNFVRLIEWPDSAFSDDDTPYVLGVFADDPFQGALEAVLEGSSIAGRPLRTMRIDSPRDAQRCHLVFVPASQTKQLSTLKRAVAEAPVLLVTEGEDLARRGAAISFYQEGDRVRFEVNRRAAQRVKLKPSSRLLRLARLVEEE